MPFDMTRYCFTLDLINDPILIEEYEAWHRDVWPEVIANIRNAGIVAMEIYRFENRLMMVIKVNPGYTHERKMALDLANNKVQEWELLMWKYQQAVPGAQPGEKWVQMKKIFEL
jgi:L-rhamnose mutarotase